MAHNRNLYALILSHKRYDTKKNYSNKIFLNKSIKESKIEKEADQVSDRIARNGPKEGSER